jgi:hypothetical protein
MLYFFDSRAFRPQNRYPPSDQVRGHAFAEYALALTARLCRLRAGGCRWDRQMSIGEDAGDGKAIMQKRGILP